MADGVIPPCSGVTELRLRLLANGYHPVALYPHDAKVKSAGKKPIGTRWPERALNATPDSIKTWEPGNTGLLTGALVGVDVDVLDSELAQQVVEAAKRILGPGPLRRIGKAPKVLLAYRTAEPGPKLETPELRLPDGQKAQVEIMGDGQQVVAFGTHPETLAPYTWSGPSPLDVPLAELPSVPQAALVAFRDEVERILRAAGGCTDKEIAAVERTPAPRGISAPKGKREASGSDYFKRVNAAALEEVDAWVHRLFPRARWQNNATTPPGAWRVASADLGRGLEEDISIHPREGCHDFGTRESKTPIDLMMEHGGAPDAIAAAAKLCEWMGKVPADFGWKEAKAKERTLTSAEGRSQPDDVELTEDGVALAFTQKFHDALRYCHDTGAWYVWQGTHWRQNRDKIAFSWARQLVRTLNRSAEFRTQAITGKASFAAAVERFAQADRAFAVTTETWDRALDLLGTPGGTVDLRTGIMRPASRKDYITKVAAVAPADTATCPTWFAFLDQATAKDKDLMRFLQQWCGYCLTGSTREHALLFIYGPGGTGKSVFLNVLAGILADYAATAAMDTFTEAGQRQHKTFLAMMRGARMVTASETEEGNAWAEAKIKQMTGGDRITANFMRQDPFTFTPQFKLTIAGNHKPVLRNVDDAARRRFNIVPFLHKPERPDHQLEHKLKAEWPGILRWMIEGCLDWQANGLVRPTIVKAATQEYFDAQDVIGRWLGERCILAPHLKIKPGLLQADCFTWAAKNGEQLPTPSQFRSAMENLKGVRYVIVNGTQWIKGIGRQAQPDTCLGGEGGGGWR